MKQKSLRFQTKIYDISEKHNIFYSLKPFYILLQVFGLSKMNKNPQKKFCSFVKIYSAFLILMIFGYQWRVLYERFVYYYWKMKVASVIMDLLIMMPVWVSSLYSLSSIIFNNPDRIYRIMNNIKCVDDKLAMNTPENYKKLRLKVTVLLIVIVVGTLLHYLFDFSVWKGDVRISLLFLMQSISELELLDLTLHVYLIYNRMSLINKKLKYDHSFVTVFIGHEICLVNNLIERKSNRSSEYDKLIELVWLFDRLSDNIDIINSYFGVQVRIFLNIFLFYDEKLI